MRTTVPFIYHLGPCVEGLDVIDFPGADDDQKEVRDLSLCSGTDVCLYSGLQVSQFEYTFVVHVVSV